MFANKSINVRNLETGVLENFHKLASIHDRSLEGEARAAIRQWCEFHQAKEDTLDVIKENRLKLSNRIQSALKIANQILFSPLTYSEIAEKLDLQNQDEAIRWFTGESSPSFQQIEQIADLLGCSSNWLKHGKLPQYPRYHFNINNEDPIQFAYNLLNTNLNGEKVKRLHLIRSQLNGRVFIIQEFSGVKSYCYSTSCLSLSEDIGNIGDYSLAKFVLSLEALYRLESDVIIKSYIISNSAYSQFFNDNNTSYNDFHPLIFLNACQESIWHEDIWDPSMTQQHWQGYRNLSQNINDYINQNTYLKKIRQEIKNLTF